MRTEIAVAALLMLGGCMQEYMIQGGQISDHVSQFDGSREMSMVAAWVCEPGQDKEYELYGCPIRLGLVWKSNADKDALLLHASVGGIFNIADGMSLWFNIDGEKVGLVSIDRTTIFEELLVTGYVTGHYSSKRYQVNRAFVRKLVSAKKVIVRMNTDRTYVEGVFTSDRETHAQKSFDKFLASLPTHTRPGVSF